ncbi:MAG: glycosyltransferase family 9 protein [Bdellovibrio sp. CG10_big_fil_rev_8_21_14_0_10_47_8]|nr:MAG: glycosyltransferase family 9 protein [Bdellovibrio sp. CG10_big_fil_rev_8_21_14_0_10_47_8]
MKIVFLRLDKIGDLIATLPADQSLEGTASDHQVHWVVAKGLGWICKVADPERQFLELDLTKPKESRKILEQFLKAEKPDLIINFYAPWWASFAAWKARVLQRVGRRSQWHSYLFFNRGLRQSRSLAEKHEADYNQELVDFALQRSPQKTPILHLNPPTKRHLFEKFNLSPGQYFIVHPGMAGSALNWPQEKYNSLIEKLVLLGPVVITGTKSDDPYLTEIKPLWQHHQKVRFLQNQLSMEDLLSLLKSAKAVVAPSTGVLHLAASLGVRSIGIYSPVRVHRALRWGPRGTQSQSLTPKVDCPATDQCLKERCPHHPCMESISVDEVMKGLGLS